MTRPTDTDTPDIVDIPSPEVLAEQEAVLRDAMGRAMAHTAAPQKLGAAALTAGRRRRQRRHASMAVGVVAASTALALGLPQVLGDGAGTPVADPGSSTTLAMDPAASSDAGPAGRPGSPWWDMPATDMLDVTRQLLPDGVTMTAPGPLEQDDEDGGPARGYITPQLSTSAGAGQLNVMLHTTESGLTVWTTEPDGSTTGPFVQPTPAGGEDAFISCPGNLTRSAHCTELRDGGELVGRRSITTHGDVTTHAVVLRRDGGTVYAAAANTLDSKWGWQSAASADVPPLTLDQLESLVRDDAWVTYTR